MPPRVSRMANHVDTGNAHCAAGRQCAGGRDRDGGGFSRAVGPQKAKDFASLQHKVNAIDSYNAELRLVNLCELFNLDDHCDSPAAGREERLRLQIIAAGMRTGIQREWSGCEVETCDDRACNFVASFLCGVATPGGTLSVLKSEC